MRIIGLAILAFACLAADRATVEIQPLNAGDSITVKITAATQPAAKVWDGCLFPHKDFKGIPRVGRIWPQGLWPDGQITADLPKLDAVKTALKGQENRQLIYFDEFNSPLWDDVSADQIQATMDRRADLIELVRQVVGPKPRIVYFGFPVYGDTAVRNIILPWYWDSRCGTRAALALRSTIDVWAGRTAPSKLHSLLGGAAFGQYWDGYSNLYVDGPSDAESFDDTLEINLEMCRIANLKPIVFMRLVSPIERKPMPVEIFDAMAAKLTGCDVVIWEDETQPTDSPLLKRMN